MRDDDLDRILSKEQEIIPSSGFVSSVMDAIQREEGAPPVIPFPWKRALPGLAAAGLAMAAIFAAGVMLFAERSETQQAPATLSSAFALVFEVWKTVGASWIALALALSFASVKVSMRFASGKK